MKKLFVFRDVMVSVNKLCRDCGDIKFFAGDIFGFFGYCFLDLVKHEYVEEVKVRVIRLLGERNPSKHFQIKCGTDEFRHFENEFQAFEISYESLRFYPRQLVSCYLQ